MAKTDRHNHGYQDRIGLSLRLRVDSVKIAREGDKQNEKQTNRHKYVPT